METYKITDHQLMCLTAQGAVGGSLIVVSAALAAIARQDAWLAALSAPALGGIVLWMYTRLGNRYQNSSLLGMAKTVLGKWGGATVSVLYLFYFLLGACRLPWYIGDFTGHIMHETPITVINLAFIAAVCTAMWYGLETTARAAELSLPVISVLFVMAMVLVLPQIKTDYLKPVLEFGINPILKGDLLISSFVVMPLISIMMIYPIHTLPGKGRNKALLIGYLWASAIVFIAILVSTLVLGHIICSKQQYPTYSLAKEIDVGTIFSRLEYLISIIWLVTEFHIAVLYGYAALMLLSELFALKNYKRLVAPLGLFMLAFSEVLIPDTVYQANWTKTTWIPYSYTFGLLFPALLLFVGWFRERFGKKMAS